MLKPKHLNKLISGKISIGNICIVFNGTQKKVFVENVELKKLIHDFFVSRSALLFEMDRRHMQSRCIDANDCNRYGPGPRISDVTNDNLREVPHSQHTETKV